MTKYNDEKRVDFTYRCMGADYDISALYKFDEYWELYEMEIEGPDGDDYTTEFQNTFERKFASVEYVSLFDLVEEKAQEKF